MITINSLLEEMISYYGGDPKRIQHFTKVYLYSKLIGEEEHLDEKTQYTLEIASIVHDIGIKPAEEKYGKCNGKLQEQEGPIVARDMLARLGLEPDILERVLYLIGHHHTYTNIDGLDYQILVEADFLVNLFEDDFDQKTAMTTYRNIFRTETGKRLLLTMYGYVET